MFHRSASYAFLEAESTLSLDGYRDRAFPVLMRFQIWQGAEHVEHMDSARPWEGLIRLVGNTLMARISRSEE